MDFEAMEVDTLMDLDQQPIVPTAIDNTDQVVQLLTDIHTQQLLTNELNIWILGLLACIFGVLPIISFFIGKGER